MGEFLHFLLNVEGSGVIPALLFFSIFSGQCCNFLLVNMAFLGSLYPLYLVNMPFLGKILFFNINIFWLIWWFWVNTAFCFSSSSLLLLVVLPF